MTTKHGVTCPQSVKGGQDSSCTCDIKAFKTEANTYEKETQK